MGLYVCVRVCVCVFARLHVRVFIDVVFMFVLDRVLVCLRVCAFKRLCVRVLVCMLV